MLCVFFVTWSSGGLFCFRFLIQIPEDKYGEVEAKFPSNTPSHHYSKPTFNESKREIKNKYCYIVKNLN